MGNNETAKNIDGFGYYAQGFSLHNCRGCYSHRLSNPPHTRRFLSDLCSQQEVVLVMTLFQKFFGFSYFPSLILQTKEPKCFLNYIDCLKMVEETVHKQFLPHGLGKPFESQHLAGWKNAS